MPTRSESPDDSSGDEENQVRLAQLERLLADQLYSTSPSVAPPAPSIITEDSAKTVEEQDVAVSFRLFSSQKGPTKVTIREKTPPPLQHSIDPRIRAVEDEDPVKVIQRLERIQKVAVSGQEILQQSNALPPPHPPSYRLSHRIVPRLPHAPATSTREPLPFPSLGYLNSILPPSLRRLSPASVPVSDVSLAPKEPNAGLLRQGPYTLGKNGTGMKRRFPIQLAPETRERRIKMRILPILEEEKDNPFVWKEKERKRLVKEKEKERKKRFKARMLKIKHGDDEKEGAVKTERKKRKGRLSKERRERAKKREAKKNGE
ncbi:uncharacterized protein JCM6883_003350 [Sporobolomyces salmoneus]|uniref:uncharacterized protein n=1 Tax=Sporobolomyces salmoneus TaxID=183962 RepID=UPI0031740FF4